MTNSGCGDQFFTKAKFDFLRYLPIVEPGYAGISEAFFKPLVGKFNAGQMLPSGMNERKGVTKEPEPLDRRNCLKVKRHKKDFFTHRGLNTSTKRILDVVTNV